MDHSRRSFSFDLLSDCEGRTTSESAARGRHANARNGKRKARKSRNKRNQQEATVTRVDSCTSIPPFDEGFDRQYSNADVNAVVNSVSVVAEEPESEHSIITDTVQSSSDPCFLLHPLLYFKEEVNRGKSLRTMTVVGSDKKRRRVYDMLFHLPWRCELLLDVGFLVCLESFLSLLTIMPAKVLVAIWRCLTRSFQRPFADELSDLGCLVVLACGVTVLQLTDISIIYHFIRGQGTIKLYVVYNVLEIFDKLCQSFGGDVLQVFFDSAEQLANSSEDSAADDLIRFISDQVIAIGAFVIHSLIILAQAITLSTAIISDNNALLALLVSNNFAEIKSNVFKRVNEQNLHKMAYYDTVERFHIMAYILFVLGQNILEEKNPWFWSFVMNASLICGCEIMVDVIKHAFLAKFNDIEPSAYSEFLEDLCRQKVYLIFLQSIACELLWVALLPYSLLTYVCIPDGFFLYGFEKKITLKSNPHEIYKALTFIPIAPACVVIRVFTPLYAAWLPLEPLWYRCFFIMIILTGTYFVLALLKILVGLCLQRHALWYTSRRMRKKQHSHPD